MPASAKFELSEGMDLIPSAPQRSFVMTSACGLCGKSSLEALKTNRCPLPADDVRIDPGVIYGLPGRLRTRQAAFDATGGIHAAALFTLSGDLMLLREDVGRHNAVDKLIGAALIDGRIALRKALILVRGRARWRRLSAAV